MVDVTEHITGSYPWHISGTSPITLVSLDVIVGMSDEPAYVWTETSH